MTKSIAQMEIDSYNRAYSEALYVEELAADEYIVNNLDHNSAYIICTDGDYVISCTCPHRTYRGVNCKHMVKVAIETGKQVI